MAGRISKNSEIDAVFPISNRAAKSIDYQVYNVAKENLHIGLSKRAEYDKLKRENNGKITPHGKGQNTGFHSWDTYHKYKSEFQTFAHYCRAEFGVKDIHDIKSSMAVSFCQELGNLKYAKNTVNSFCSAIEKFGSFLKIDFHADLQGYKKTEDYKALESKDTNTRAYSNPQNIIDTIGNAKAQFSAHLALCYGLRISDACHFRLDGDKILFNSKNGMKTEKTLLPQDATRAADLVDGNGKYNLSTSTMKTCWVRACAANNVENTGFHGLRHTFCQNLHNDLTSNKELSHQEACLICSHEMNHSRPDITETYLR